MEYTIISAKTAITIERNVTALIAEGWAPCGGVGFGKEFFVQAMTRDPMTKLFHDKATSVVSNTSLFGGNGATEKP